MSDDARYIDWNYDTHEAVEYRRLGECNLCGQCCMARVAFNVAKGTPDAREGGESPDGKGVWTEWSDGNQRRFFRFHEVDASIYQPCPLLIYDSHRCRIHERGKKLIHHGWPFSPQNVTPFKKCSYRFEEIKRWVFE